MIPGINPFSHLDPTLFESAIDRAVRQAGVDKAAFAATFGPVIDPVIAARIKADLARATSFLPIESEILSC